jgi:hypothetical protein
MHAISIQDYTTINHQILTKNQFYDRYHFLSRLEEELDDHSEQMDPKNAQELAVLVNLFIKEKQNVLFKKELVERDHEKNEYYYVRFQDDPDDRIEKLTNSIKKCLAIKSTKAMLHFFQHDQWYKSAILNQIHTTYLNSLVALKNSHEINMKMIKTIKRIESLHMDVMTTDIYPIITRIFSLIFESYSKQIEFNKQYNEQILDFIFLHQENDQESLSQREQLTSSQISAKRRIIENIGQLGENLTKSNSQLEEVISFASQKVSYEFNKLSPSFGYIPSYKAFIAGVDATMQETNRHLISSNDVVKVSWDLKLHYNKVFRSIDTVLKHKSHYDIDKDCSNDAVWIIEYADTKILEATRYALASISFSVQSMKSNWNIKMNALNQRFTHLLAFSTQTNSCKNKEIYLSQRLNEILALQSICIQNAKHSEEIRRSLEEEQHLFEQEVTSISERAQKVFIRNSSTNKYLKCNGEEILDEKHIKLGHKHSTISLVPYEESNRIIWDLIEGDGGKMIRNTVSSQYLTHSPDEIRLKEIRVIGTYEHFLNQKRLLAVEKFQGQWKEIKIEDVLAKAHQLRKQATARLLQQK